MSAYDLKVPVSYYSPDSINEDVIEEHKFFSLNSASRAPDLVVASLHQKLFCVQELV